MSFTGFGRMCLTADEPLKPFDDNPLTAGYAALPAQQCDLCRSPRIRSRPADGALALRSAEDHRQGLEPEASRLDHGTDRHRCARQRSDRSLRLSRKLSQYFRAGQLVPVPGSRHEILHERDRYRAQALAAFHAFIPGGDDAPAAEAVEKSPETIEE